MRTTYELRLGDLPVGLIEQTPPKRLSSITSAPSVTTTRKS
jgi:hypothetical protein